MTALPELPRAERSPIRRAAIGIGQLSLPESVLSQPRVQRVAALLPAAMLSALVAMQLFDGGGRYLLDRRTLAGVGAAVVALLLRQGFLVVFLVAIGATALLRLRT